MTDPKVVHPTTQNRIDFRNHILHGPADLLSERGRMVKKLVVPTAPRTNLTSSAGS